MTTNYQNLLAIYDYRDATKYIYNSDLVVFTEYGAQLKDRVAGNVGLGATFRQFTDANYGNGSFNLSAVTTGSGICSIQNDKLALLGGQFTKALDYFSVDNFANKIPNGQITFQYYPNYSNNPSTPQNIFHLGEHDLYPKNHLEILHTTGSDIIVNYFTDSNNLFTHTKNSVLVETALTPMEFRIAWKSLSNQNEPEIEIAVYLNGERICSQLFSATSFDLSKILKFGFGQNLEIKQYPNFYISYLIVENIIPDFSETYTPQSYLPMVETRYATSAQKIEPLMDLTLERLIEIVDVTNEDLISKSFYVNYTFQIDGVEYFFDRTDLTWKIHEEPEDISELSYMLLYKDQLITHKGTQFKVIPYLRTINGHNTPQITSMQVRYDEFIPCEENYPTALIYGYVKDVLGNPVTGAKVLVTPSRSSVSEVGNFILPKLTKSVRTGVNGYWDVQLTLSNNFDSEVLYNFQIVVRDEIVFEIANIKISKEGTIKFEDLINENESVG